MEAKNKTGPKMIYDTKIKNVYVGLPDEVRVWFENESKARKVSMGSLLRTAAEDFISHNSNPTQSAANSSE